MSDRVVLHGMDFSVYVRIARLALIEKGVGYTLCPLNPFASDPPDPNRGLHPFGKMPVLVHGAEHIIETQAIVRYVDEAFPGPALQPESALDRARQNQIIGICDSYLYQALVWDVFVEELRKPDEGGETDLAVVTAGLAVTDKAFAVIDGLLPDAAVSPVGIADCYLMPILEYGLRVPSAARLAKKYPRLCMRWSALRSLDSALATEPSEFIEKLPPHVLL